MRTPVEPPPSAWAFPPVDQADDSGVVAVGGDLEPGTILAAYRNGLFPMPFGRRGELAWWSPDPEGSSPSAGSGSADRCGGVADATRYGWTPRSRR